MKKFYTTIFILFLILILNFNVNAQILLPSVINDNMVLQRDIKIPIWGKTVPNSKVSIKFLDRKKVAFADAEGYWTINLDPIPVTFNRQKMSIETENDKIILTNILVGEVWLCSGQSNMQFPVRKMNGAKNIINSATNSNIRFININRFNFKPYECDNCLGEWTECSKKTIPKLTAVGYSFALELYKKINVPIGLIEADFGGTKIESWTKTDILKKWPWLKNITTEFEKYKNNKNFALMKRCEMKNWFNKIKTLDKGFDKNWWLPNLNTKNWGKLNAPITWDNITNDLKNFHGSVWLRKSLIIPDDWKYKNLIVNPGAINGRDIVWINGNIAGMMQIFGVSHHQRNYEIKGNKFHTGTNSIVIWNYCSKYNGGLRGPKYAMRIFPKGEKEKAISLAGQWAYKIGYCGIDLPEPPASMKLCYKSPAVLYNSMIAPVIPYAIKGVLWYQGESNQRAPSYYQEMFTDMVESWRYEWNQGDFPFYYVQIAPFNYNNKVNSALLREAQCLSMKITNTGMVVTMDIGNPNDIHPKNKLEVGRRLALWALVNDYGFTNLVCSGPIYKNIKIKNDKILVYFNYANGLKTNDGKMPSHFEIAGADKKFYPASAKIEKNYLIVSSDKVKKPVAVRYAWSNSAEPNLCNAAGLPVSPFRAEKQ